MKHTLLIKWFGTSLLTLVACVSLAQPKSIDKVVGVVGNEMILYSEVQSQLLEMIQNKIPVNENTECVLMENYLFNALLLHQAKVDSIEANMEQIEAEIDAKMDYYRQLLEQYDQTFESAYGKSEIEWREELLEVMQKRSMIEQMQAMITQNVTITPREVRNYFKGIPKDSIERINSHVEYGHIILVPEVSQEADFRERDNLIKWREEIKRGDADFEFYATAYSDDPGSSGKGGDFGCVSKGMFVKEFDAMALSMEVGEISEPFRTQYGWHILQLEERRGTTYCGKHILRIPAVSAENITDARERLDSIARAIQNGGISFCKAALKWSDDEESKYMCGKILNPMDGSTMWDESELERTEAVILNNMEPGEVTEPIKMDTRDGKQAFRIVTIFKRTPPHYANLAQDYDMLQFRALNRKKQDVIDRWVLSRINASHIWVAPDYRDCPFKYNWLKESPILGEKP